MIKKHLLFLSLFFLINIFVFKPALAGFGISPPYVTNDNLARGSVYEKKITIVRGNPDEDLKAEITINVDKASNWITINRGNEFILPKGEKQVPIIVTIKVPKDAPLGNYKGYIRIKTTPVEALEKGIVSIALGAQIDVNFTVTNASIFDFIVRGVRFLSVEEGVKRWIFHFPTKIVAEFQLENLGNINCKPTKAVLNIYDQDKGTLIERIETQKMTTVKPFEIGVIKAIFLSQKLKAGNYQAHYQIYKNEEIALGGEGDLRLVIAKAGTIKGYKGVTIFDLPMEEKLILSLCVFTALFAVSFVFLRFLRKGVEKNKMF